MNLTITETPAFTKLIAAYADEDYRALQNVLLNDPLRGKVIPGGGGIRKIRMAIKGKGKSGGARVSITCTKRTTIFSCCS